MDPQFQLLMNQFGILVIISCTLCLRLYTFNKYVIKHLNFLHFCKEFNGNLFGLSALLKTLYYILIRLVLEYRFFYGIPKPMMVK